MAQRANKHLENLSAEWLRGVDVLHRPGVFSTRFVLHTDGEKLYFSSIDFDKDGNILESNIDENPWGLDSLRHWMDQAKAKIRLGESNTETKSHQQLPALG